MDVTGKGVRTLTKQVNAWLQVPSLEAALASIASLPPEKVIKPLFSCLCSCDRRVKWQAVSAMGQSVAKLADQEMESARVVMRRFMWMLNDESGGIGWGVPEALGETLACHQGLAEEYGHVLVSFMREDGFYLELEAMQGGLLWGVARAATVRSQLLRSKNVVRYLLPYLNSKDPLVLGFACLALGRLGEGHHVTSLRPFQEDQRLLSLYQNGNFLEVTVGTLARQAMAQLDPQCLI
ncbi:MAG: HEAT repeat domain-containing protein [Desulfobulbaceae bacterium]|nr:HEAT repeat domain-containing protein [Desulfobulbaceae bacterium]